MKKLIKIRKRWLLDPREQVVPNKKEYNRRVEKNSWKKTKEEEVNEEAEFGY